MSSNENKDKDQAELSKVIQHITEMKVEMIDISTRLGEDTPVPSERMMKNAKHMTLQVMQEAAKSMHDVLILLRERDELASLNIETKWSCD